jgi:enoyl-CoA hydratase/carnithine racemase
VTGSSATFTQIAYSVDDRVATIVLDREDRLNAFTPVMREELIAAFDRTDADDEVRALVITGRGRAFCAGADLGGGTSTFDNAGEARQADIAVRGTIAGVARDGAGRVTLRMARSLKPIIAAVNGAAVGAGVTLTLAADVRLASATAKFGFVFARRGIVPEGASTWFLPRLVGVSKAMEWIATGRIFGAEEALEGRLVSALYEPTELLEAAGRLAREIAGNRRPWLWRWRARCSGAGSARRHRGTPTAPSRRAWTTSAGVLTPQRALPRSSRSGLRNSRSG